MIKPEFINEHATTSMLRVCTDDLYQLVIEEKISAYFYVPHKSGVSVLNEDACIDCPENYPYGNCLGDGCADYMGKPLQGGYYPITSDDMHELVRRSKDIDCDVYENEISEIMEFRPLKLSGTVMVSLSAIKFRRTEIEQKAVLSKDDTEDGDTKASVQTLKKMIAVMACRIARSNSTCVSGAGRISAAQLERLIVSEAEKQNVDTKGLMSCRKLLNEYLSENDIAKLEIP